MLNRREGHVNDREVALLTVSLRGSNNYPIANTRLGTSAQGMQRDDTPPSLQRLPKQQVASGLASISEASGHQGSRQGSRSAATVPVFIVSENGDGGVVDLGLDRKGGYVRDCIVR